MGSKSTTENYQSQLISFAKINIVVFFSNTPGNWLVPSRLKLSLLINYLLGKRLGYARGEDGIPFVKEPVLVFHAKTDKLQVSANYYLEVVFSSNGKLNSTVLVMAI